MTSFNGGERGHKESFGLRQPLSSGFARGRILQRTGAAPEAAATVKKAEEGFGAAIKAGRFLI
jgi:hypothetical protein